MKLARFVEENLVAPLIVGTIAGSFAALITADFLSQFGPATQGSSQWSATAIVWMQAIKAFLFAAGGVVVVFGVIPAICEWKASSDEERTEADIPER